MSRQYFGLGLWTHVVLAMPLATGLLAQTVEINEARATDGYRLISRLNDQTTRLIDKAGTTVHAWVGQYGVSSLATLQPDGTLLRTCGLPDTGFTAGGAGGRIELLDWDGGLVWAYDYNSSTQILHHDVKRLPNGNYLMLVWHRKSQDEAIAAGVDPSHVGGLGVLFERIIEVRPEYPYGGEIVWEWSLFDHLIQDRFEEEPNFGNVPDHPELVNVHFTVGTTSADWFHANAIDYNPALDQIAISVRNLSELWIIDHSTTTEEAATHSGGRHGKGGDLLYRWGNPAVWSAGTEQDQQLGLQHNVQWIEPGLPGEGHLLIFNNSDPARPAESQIVEVELPLNADGSYGRGDGVPLGPKAPVWAYSAATPGEFSSVAVSGMQRLPNGNTLICSGMKATVFEVAPDGEVLWKFVERKPDEPSNVLLFRANWFPASYPGFIGTPIFRPEPETANRAEARR